MGRGEIRFPHRLDVQSIRKDSPLAQLVSFVGYVIVKAYEAFVRWAISDNTQKIPKTHISPTDHERDGSGCMRTLHVANAYDIDVITSIHRLSWEGNRMSPANAKAEL